MFPQPMRGGGLPGLALNPAVTDPAGGRQTLRYHRFRVPPPSSNPFNPAG